MKILYTGALFDSSGYAEAARNYILALMSQPGIELSLQSVSFESWKTNQDIFFNKVKHLLNKNMSNPDIHIIHLTPENFPKYHRPGIFTIGYTVWETDKIPEHWTGLCNGLDEIWVPCDWNVDVFKNSGVTKPIKKIPHCIDLAEFDNLKIADSIANQINSNKFNFYSIYQWSSRKNPEGLIKAYLSEFNSNEDVCLVLKTYLMNDSLQDKERVIELIKHLKVDLQLKDTPPILLIHGALSRNEILTIHQLGDCFVLPHRAEGWGVPHFEALAMSKPVIATGFGGNLEFMQAKNSWLINFNMTPVSNMGRPTYNGKMQWAEPHIDCLQRHMRAAFNDRDLVKTKGLAGKEKVKEFSIESIGNCIYQHLKEIKHD